MTTAATTCDIEDFDTPETCVALDVVKDGLEAGGQFEGFDRFCMVLSNDAGQVVPLVHGMDSTQAIAYLAIAQSMTISRCGYNNTPGAADEQ